MSALTRFEELLEVYLTLLDNAATFLLTVALVYVTGRFVLAPIVGYAMELRGTERTLREGIESIVSVGVITTAILVGLTIAGLDFVLERTAILVAALTVALGFAAQNVIGNLVSGAFIVTDPAFNIDDWIRWEDKEGIIEDISFRSTRVRTFDNEVVSVPNSELTASAVTNAVFNDRLRLELSIDLNFDDDLETGIEILSTAAADHPEILDEPEPFVRVTELEETVQVTSRFWISNPDRAAYGRIRSEYARTVLERFAAAGIDLGMANPQALEGEVGVVQRRGPGGDGGDDRRDGNGGDERGP